MKSSYIILTVVIVAVLSGLFVFRASKTVAYKSGEGKFPTTEEVAQSYQQLYKNSAAAKTPPPAAATDSTATAPKAAAGAPE